jgi:hypothetical protein
MTLQGTLQSGPRGRCVSAEHLAIVIWESSVSMQERLVAHDHERISRTEEFRQPDR